VKSQHIDGTHILRRTSSLQGADKGANSWVRIEPSSFYLIGRRFTHRRGHFNELPALMQMPFAVSLESCCCRRLAKMKKVAELAVPVRNEAAMLIGKKEMWKNGKKGSVGK
jgi:hypothetical protein